MSKKSRIVVGAVFGLLALLGVVFVFCEKESKPNVPTNNQTTSMKNESDSSLQEKDLSLQKSGDTTVFVTDVDPDVNHWQTKETEFFTIKFPKEWYWMESAHSESEGYSKVITNNPHFDIERYADIGIGAGIGYPLVLTNNTEIVITMGGVAVTYEVGTPLESIDWQIERVKKYINPKAVCRRNDVNIPYPTASCSFAVDNQEIRVYFVAEKSVTYAFTARTTQKNTANVEEILENVARSYIVPER